MKTFLKKYNHIWTVLYAFIYVPWFMWLEKTVVTDYTPIHIGLDDIIPFCELFIIPYYLWFLYVAAGFVLLFLTSKSDYYKLCMFLFTGMTLFLIICTIYPNGQDLRMEITRDNIFANLVKNLYKTDTNTNVFPSIHVFNSLGIMIALNKSTWLKKKSYGSAIQWSSTILAILIVLSTVFLKQHSCVDAIGGIIMAIILYYIVYIPNWKFLNKIDNTQ